MLRNRLGQPLTVAAGAGVLANDQDSAEGTLTATRVAPAAHGTVVLNSDGSFTYTPNSGFAGLDSFTYQASDGSLLSNVATVFLAVDNGAPRGQQRSLHRGARPAVDDRRSRRAVQRHRPRRPAPHGRARNAVATQQGGTVTLNADGSFTYTPKAHIPAPTRSRTWTPMAGSEHLRHRHDQRDRDHAVGRADSYTVPEDDPSNVPQQSVLLNDTDADGDALTA